LTILTLVLAVLLSTAYEPGALAGSTMMAKLAIHPILLSMLRSLLLDTGSTLFPIGIRCFLAILPFAPQALTGKVPLLMAILGRAACWRLRPFVDAGTSNRDAVTTTHLPNPSLAWSIATSATEKPMSLPPNLQPEKIVRLLFVAVYYAWPSNFIAFLRDPAAYLRGKATESVYDVDWEEVWEPGLLAARAGPLLRNFHLHPSMIYFASASELADSKRWDKVDPSEFVSRSHMLAHSELLSGDRFDLMEGEPLVKQTLEKVDYAEGIVSHDGTEASAPLNNLDDLGKLKREIDLLRLEARFEDRVRKQHLYRKSAKS
jgi:hypothetical protein